MMPAKLTRAASSSVGMAASLMGFVDSSRDRAEAGGGAAAVAAVGGGAAAVAAVSAAQPAVSK